MGFGCDTMKTLLVCALLVACEGCTFTTSSKPGPIPNGPVTDDTVTAACANLRRIGCPEGQATPGGATCEEVLRANIPPNGGVDANCLTVVTTCDQESRCTISLH